MKNDQQKTLGKQTKTARGFSLIKFIDRYGSQCSLQASSLAGFEQPGTSAIWLGVDNADPQVSASKAHQFGIETDQTTGWVAYPVPEDGLLTTRMYLGRSQVEALIYHLQTWLDSECGQFVLNED